MLDDNRVDVNLFPFLLVLGILLFLPSGRTDARSDDKLPLEFEGEIENSVIADFRDDVRETGTALSFELEIEDNLNLDVGLGSEYETGEGSAQAVEFDLELFPATPDDNLELFFGADISDPGGGGANLGAAAEFGGTDYEVGLEIGETETLGYLELYHRYESGVRLSADLELKNGASFNYAEVDLGGVIVNFGKTPWELSGKIKAEPIGASPFAGPDFLEGSISLVNQSVYKYGLPGRKTGICLFQLEVLAEEEDEKELARVVLLNPTSERVEIGGWTLRNGRETFSVPEGKDIGPGEKVSVFPEEDFIDRGDELELLDPGGTVIDSWSFPMFFEPGEVLYRREAIRERTYEVSIEKTFQNLTAEWDIEIPTGETGLVYGNFSLAHTGEVTGARLGFQGERFEAELSPLDGEMELAYLLATDRPDFAAELSIDLNTEHEFETEFEIEQEFESFELTNTLTLETYPEGSEIEIEQELSWSRFELDSSFLLEDGSLSEFQLGTELQFA